MKRSHLVQPVDGSWVHLHTTEPGLQAVQPCLSRGEAGVCSEWCQLLSLGAACSSCSLFAVCAPGWGLATGGLGWEPLYCPARGCLNPTLAWCLGVSGRPVMATQLSWASASLCPLHSPAAMGGRGGREILSCSQSRRTWRAPSLPQALRLAPLLKPSVLAQGFLGFFCQCFCLQAPQNPAGQSELSPLCPPQCLWSSQMRNRAICF